MELKAVLALKDGTVFKGKGFGFPTRIVGEVVFTTGMVGYTESLTDPSYRGQILCFTYPLMGNYGVPSYNIIDNYELPLYFESNKIQVSGVIVSEYCNYPDHYSSTKSLQEWLYNERIPGIYDIDTRELTKKLRSHGVMMGCLEVSHHIKEDELFDEIKRNKDYGEIDFVSQVSIKEPLTYFKKEKNVVLIDCGVKNSIIRNLLKRDLGVIRLPYNVSYEDVLSYNPAGVVISNGPGDPERCVETINLTKRIIEDKIPLLGICLGNQILALALKGKTFKLKYGHRGQNKACIDLTTGRGFITSQNHGYAVDPKSIEGSEVEVWFTNADDATVEGLRSKDEHLLAVQYHPEASPGPYDTTFIFDIFAKVIKKEGENFSKTRMD
ncbi:MAG: glutamine-hydrolyzing carbamoyl-phosphate synthase small subunit [Nitrososphaerales archaeon]